MLPIIFEKFILEPNNISIHRFLEKKIGHFSAFD
jgi:hypothetical protein